MNRRALIAASATLPLGIGLSGCSDLLTLDDPRNISDFTIVFFDDVSEDIPVLDATDLPLDEATLLEEMFDAAVTEDPQELPEGQPSSDCDSEHRVWTERMGDAEARREAAAVLDDQEGIEPDDDPCFAFGGWVIQYESELLNISYTVLDD